MDRLNQPLAGDGAFSVQFAVEGFEQPRFQRFCGNQVKNGVDMPILQQGFLSSSLCRMDTISASWLADIRGKHSSVSRQLAVIESPKL